MARPDRPRQARLGPGSSGSPGQSRRNANFNFTKPIVESYANWRSWPQCTVLLSNIPKGTPMAEIYNILKPYGGSMESISITNNNKVFSQAYVTFSPVPSQAFWNRPYIATDSQAPGRITAEIQPPKLVTSSSYDGKQMDYSLDELEFSATDLAFGIMETEDQFTAMRRIHPLPEGPITLKLEAERREMHILFSIMSSVLEEDGNAPEAGVDLLPSKSSASPSNASQDTAVSYKMVVPFKQLPQIWVRQSKSDGTHLIFPCETPAKLFRKIADPASTMAADDRYWHGRRAWLRQTDIVLRGQGLRRKSEPLALDQKDPYLDFGSWTVIALRVPLSWPKSDKAGTLASLLDQHNVPVNYHNGLNMCQSLSRVPLVWTYLGDYDNTSDVGLRNGRLSAERVNLSWPVRYQFEACMSQNVLNPWNVTLEFLHALKGIPEKKALRLLEYALDNEKRIYRPMELLSSRVPAGHGIKKIPTYCVLQRAANITPSSVHYCSPTVEVSNRVIRQWGQYADRFLRVRFMDEKVEGRLFSSDDEINDVIFNRFYRCLMNGITIGDRHYEFLASGNSQLREHGAYFFAGTSGCNVQQIRRLMGDFRDIKIPAKYASRMGQCFSTTRAVNSSSVKITELSDVTRNGYTFTDGCGKISEFLLKVIASEHRMPYVPSAIQIRLGGCKGVLAQWANVDKSQLEIRPSQYKFPSSHTGLEVIRGSTFVWGQLNRQLITNLECLGVPADTFLKKMDRQLRGVDDAMTDPGRALEQLERRIDSNYVTLTIADMVRSGFMDTAEPFTMAALHLWRSWTHKTLKEKASIHIEKAAFVMGVTDETQSLRGHSDSDPSKLPQIFLQIRHPVTKVKEVIEGTCVVMRNPTLHPGDVRVVKAVNKTELHHLTDVVVFSQKGDRDVPSMCSGGDLDGDDFFVSWDPKLLPQQRNHPPMKQLQSQVHAVKEVSIHDVINFSVTYWKQDSLGRIANCWLALADKYHLSGGPKHPDCVRLAQEHSVAVDFPKTGQPACGKLVSRLSPKEYPHFMENKFKPPFKSRSACGMLYDRVDRVAFTPRVEGPFDSRILEYFNDLSPAVLKQAKKTKDAYDSAITRIMTQFDIQTEFEICTAFILHHSTTANGYELHTTVSDLYEQVKDDFCKEIIERVGGSESVRLWPFVCAMYRVTAEEVATEVARQEAAGVHEVDRNNLPKISFPWIFSRELGKIARDSDAHQGSGPRSVEAMSVPMDAVPGGPEISNNTVTSSNSSSEDSAMPADGTLQEQKSSTSPMPSSDDSAQAKAEAKDPPDQLANSLKMLSVNGSGQPHTESDQDEACPNDVDNTEDDDDDDDEEEVSDRLGMLEALAS